LKRTDDASLAALSEPVLYDLGCDVRRGPSLATVVGLLKERVNTVRELAWAAVYFYRAVDPPEDLRRQHYAPEARAALEDLKDRLARAEWTRPGINDAIKGAVAAHGLKMPRVAMPLRVMVTGQAQTPSIDATLELIGRAEVLAR